jgi:hypothetical protein
MDKPIDNGRGRHRIGKDIRPVGEREVGTRATISKQNNNGNGTEGPIR